MNPEEEEPNLSGDCAEGYYGALCSTCKVGYSRTGDYGCAKCIDPAINITKIAFVLMAFVIVVVLMVRSALNNATKKNVHSVYIKIFANHA